MQYRKDIDGLRGIAVLSVILCHANFSLFSGGYTGVDVFFVISGFLISNILIEELSTDKFSFIKFYERRARRILPVLYLVIFVCIPVSWFVLWPDDLESFFKSLVAVPVFLSNILFWLESGYFETHAQLKPLLHTWSLSIEEQYYLLFPLFIFFSVKLRQKYFFTILILLFTASFSLSVFLSYQGASSNFYILPSRIWEFLFGTFLALFLQRKARPNNSELSDVISLTGLLLIAISVVKLDENTPFPGWYTIYAVLGAGLIIASCDNSRYIKKILEYKYLIFIGYISYSAYLWHHPVFAYYRYTSVNEPQAIVFMALILLTLFLSFLTWKYVETPFRDKRIVSARAVAVYSFIGIALFAGVGYAGYSVEGRVPFGVFDRVDENKSFVLDVKKSYKPKSRVDNCYDVSMIGTENYSSSCKDEDVEIVMWGDSHAAALSNGLSHIFPKLKKYSTSSCSAIIKDNQKRLKDCNAINTFVLQELVIIKPKIILIHARWNRDYDFLEGLQDTLLKIHNSLPDAFVFVIGTMPQWQPGLPLHLLKNNISLDKSSWIPTDLLTQLRKSDVKLKVTSEEFQNVRFFSLIDLLCHEEQCQAVIEHEDKFVPLVWDYGHLTEAGALFLSNSMEDEIKSAL